MMFKKKLFISTMLQNRIDTLRRQIQEGEKFLITDKEKVKLNPKSIGLKLALSSMEGVLSKLRIELGNAIDEQNSFYKEIETWATATWNDHLFPLNGLNDRITICFSDPVAKFWSEEEFRLAKSRLKFTSISEPDYPVFLMEQNLIFRNTAWQKFELLETQSILNISQKNEPKVEGCANEELLSAA